MRAVAVRQVARCGVVGVWLVLAGCGAQPDKPVLANVPKPNTAVMAGGAAAAAAAITLASPDSHNPEKQQDAEKRPIKVKENVPSDVLDRADAAKSPTHAPASTTPTAKSPAPAPASTTPTTQPAGTATPPKAPKGALDFSND